MGIDSRLPTLLLLPAPPRPSSHAPLAAAYRETLAVVLTKLRDAPGASIPPVLVIALALPLLSPEPRSARTQRVPWRRAQAIIAGLYTLVAEICASSSIATDVGAREPGAVDARVVLVDHDLDKKPQSDDSAPIVDIDEKDTHQWNGTNVLDLEGFASKIRPWENIYHPSSEKGYALVMDYLRLAERHQRILQAQIIAVTGGLSLSTEEKLRRRVPSHISAEGEADDDDGIMFGTVCLGGTFDHLHPGHKLLLHAAALLMRVPKKDGSSGDNSGSATLIVGISSDELLKNKKYASELQSWDERAMSVLSFLSTVFNSPKPLSRANDEAAQKCDEGIRASLLNGAVVVRCVDIGDPFGPTISEETIDAIVVSGETRSGGAAINSRRSEKGWAPLRVYEIDVLDAERDSAERGGEQSADGGEAPATTTAEFAAKISSTAIRQQRAEARAAQGQS